MARPLVLFVLSILLAGSATAQDSEAPKEEPKAIDESKLTDQEKVQLAHIRQFTNLVHDGKYAESLASFDETTRAQVSTEFIEHSWKTMLELKGAWKADVVTSTTHRGEVFVVKLTSRFEKGDIEYTYACDKTPLVAGLSFVLGPPEELRSLATEFLELVEKEEFEEATAMFDTVMKGLISADQLKQGAEGLETAYGKIVRYNEMRYIPVPGGVFPVIVTLEYERGKVGFQLAFNDKKEIAGWAVIPAENVDVKALAEEADQAEKPE